MPLPTPDGRQFVTVHNRHYWLYRLIRGRNLNSIDRTRSRQIARMMATYHSMIETSPLDNGRKHDLFSKGRVLVELRSYRSETLGQSGVDEAASAFSEESAALIPLLEGLDETSYSGLKEIPFAQRHQP
jgi:Ser/Thr protein kinase RdoA (MazF antagonist)